MKKIIAIPVLLFCRESFKLIWKFANRKLQGNLRLEERGRYRKLLDRSANNIIEVNSLLLKVRNK